MMRLISILIILLFCSSIFGQVLRFNIEGKAIGVATPHHWSPYSHMEIKLFPHPFVDSVRISGMFMQFGYNWIKRERINVRSALKVVMWGFVPSYKLFRWSTFYKYFDLVPASITIYPFDRHLMGFDLYVIFDPYSATINNGITLIVNLR